MPNEDLQQWYDSEMKRLEEELVSVNKRFKTEIFVDARKHALQEIEVQVALLRRLRERFNLRQYEMRPNRPRRYYNFSNKR